MTAKRPFPDILSAGRATPPSVDISEDDREIRIAAELPGVADRDIEVTLHDDILTIRGERRADPENRLRSYHVAERPHGVFARTLRLPFTMQPDTVQASFENGVLTVTLPKPVLDPRNAHRIHVRPGASPAGLSDRVPADPASTARSSAVAVSSDAVADVRQQYEGFAEAVLPHYETQPNDRALSLPVADQSALSSSASEDPFIARVCAKLGLPPVRSEMELLEQVERGLPIDAVRALAGNGASQAEIYDLVIPRRTLDHRAANGQPLTRDESDKLVRVARVVTLAEMVFGDPHKAERWLRKPKVRLAGSLPMQRLATDMGARLVEEMLQQIHYGIAA